ncbi:hypothetical protein SAMN02910265_00469 [Ruminococcus flavefaciens]|uniref:Uncharacterized protein n=1 Tax=Ruminococcus flavefaciens TaxID=1265 RepID=A0A1H6I311_RUMFL|nr:hypothetical protein [Ruminococcus flavefaciens]SEH40972.1 hypothetical protein SAMN02910265_00469 [Ruminococcus flavefaciens]
MKAFIKSFIAVLFTVTMCVFGSTNAYAWANNDYSFIIEYKNAPEGTVFADILFKNTEGDIYGIGKDGESPCSSVNIKYSEEETNEGYVGYNTRNINVKERTIELDKDCGLAKYDDGYTSLMFRRALATEYTTSDGEYRPVTILLGTKKAKNTEISSYYGSLKVAYCDEKGNVLMVTEAYEPEITDEPVNYYVKADGQSLKCTLDHGINVGKGISAVLIGSVVIKALFLVIVGAIILIVVLHDRKRRNDQYPDR